MISVFEMIPWLIDKYSSFFFYPKYKQNKVSINKQMIYYSLIRTRKSKLDFNYILLFPILKFKINFQQ